MGVKRRRRLVQHDEGRIPVQGARQHQALRFAARKKDGVFENLTVQIGFIPVLQGFHFLAKPCPVDARPHPVHIHLDIILGDIGRNRAGKERKALEHRRKHGIVIPSVIVPDVLAV